MDEEMLAFFQRALEAADEVYMEMIAKYAAEELQDALAAGGELYEQIMAGAIAGAEAWYAMYSPTVYQRGYTMSNPGNIQISSSISVSGTSLSASCTTTNISPHANYAEGFWMYKRGKPFWRPGGDLMQSVPSSLSFTVDVPQDVADSCFDQALQSVL